jgi:hypothetical protein
MGDVANILVGPGELYLAPVGTTPPDEDENVLSWSGWTNMGYTDGGVEVEYTPEIADHFVDQETGPVKSTLSSEQFIVRAPLAESTLGNLNKAISASALSTEAAAGGVTGKDILVVGSGPLTEWALGFEAESPESQADGTQGWRLLIVWRVLSVAAIGQAYRKGEKTLFNSEFRAQVDSSKSKGERMFRLVDWTAAAT